MRRRGTSKLLRKIATFAPAPIPSLADGDARRPVTTYRSVEKKNKSRKEENG
ncbi:MAG: hypothetical protein ACOZAR_03270 [Patescibacteria group bacterium]